MELKFGDIHINTCGELPDIGKSAPNFDLVDPDLNRVTLRSFKNRPVLLNVFPSIDTKVCSASVNYFNKQITQYPNLEVICVSVDTPFAMKRHCAGFDYDKITLLSDFQQRSFGKSYGLTIIDSTIAGVLARAVIILDAEHSIVFRYVCPDVSQSVEFESVEQALNDLL